MGVRVKIRIRVGSREIITIALVNSGFESTEPDIAIPVNVAESLGIWPPREFELEEATTAGGIAQLYVLRNVAEVSLILNSKEVSKKGCNLLINPHIDEVLLSDYMIDELGIIVVSFRKGLWRHVSDPENKVRESAQP